MPDLFAPGDKEQCARPITERMAEALHRLRNAEGPSWRRVTRTPKAFYLNAADDAEFTATKPEQITASFRGIVTSEPGFDGVPVRRSTGGQALCPSKLYSEAGTSVQVRRT
jgi:hypothetical protein